jgi:DMSO/TMAO reductase YedYZ heme-binding membrane subunit
MEGQAEKFDFHQTVDMVWQAATGVIGHCLFDAAVHGFVLAAILALVALILSRSKHRFTKPLFAVSRRLSIVCAIVAVPGVLYLIFTRSLPYSGNYNVTSLGYIVWWSMVSVHMCAEEMNFQWFIKGDGVKEPDLEKSS